MKIAVVGANGRMGQEILRASLGVKEKVEFIGVVRSGEAKDYSLSSEGLTEKLAKTIDVVIDFSLPTNFENVLSFCEKHRKPLVSGVTGLSVRQKKTLTQYAKKTPILWSSNMSLGVILLRKALKALKDISGFDVQIIEWHHRNKRDNPSGTAKALEDELSKIGPKSMGTPMGVRGGGIVGIHKVCLMSMEEILVFEHQALNRSCFALGAIKAALWLRKKKPGLYSMDDVLK